MGLALFPNITDFVQDLRCLKWHHVVHNAWSKGGGGLRKTMGKGGKEGLSLFAKYTLQITLIG